MASHHILDLIEDNATWLIYPKESDESGDYSDYAEQLKVRCWKQEDVIVGYPLGAVVFGFARIRRDKLSRLCLAFPAHIRLRFDIHAAVRRHICRKVMRFRSRGQQLSRGWPCTRGRPTFKGLMKERQELKLGRE